MLNEKSADNTDLPWFHSSRTQWNATRMEHERYTEMLPVKNESYYHIHSIQYNTRPKKMAGTGWILQSSHVRIKTRQTYFFLWTCGLF